MLVNTIIWVLKIKNFSMFLVIPTHIHKVSSQHFHSVMVRLCKCVEDYPDVSVS